MPYKDKSKQVEYQKEWSRNNRAKIRVKAINLLGGKCVNCGYNKNPVALQIDHIEPILRVKNDRIKYKNYDKPKRRK